MANTVVALYDDMTQAEHAVAALVQAGFERSDISLVANDPNGSYAHLAENPPVDDDVKAGEGAGFGAVVGTLVGLGVALIPGIGPVLAAGPLAAALMAGIGAAAGAVTGGVVAALVDFGVPETEAELYAEGIRRGGALVTVRVTQDSWLMRAEDVLKRFSPINLDERKTDWPGYTSPAATSNVTQQAAYGTTAPTPATTTVYQPYSYYEPMFREHFRTAYAPLGELYDEYGKAYRYGYTLAVDPRYRDEEWIVLQDDAHQYWDSLYPNTWERFKDTVHEAWCRVTDRC